MGIRRSALLHRRSGETDVAGGSGHSGREDRSNEVVVEEGVRGELRLFQRETPNGAMRLPEDGEGKRVLPNQLSYVPLL